MGRVPTGFVDTMAWSYISVDRLDLPHVTKERHVAKLNSEGRLVHSWVERSLSQTATTRAPMHHGRATLHFWRIRNRGESLPARNAVNASLVAHRSPAQYCVRHSSF